MGEQSCTDRCIAKYLEVRSTLNVYTIKENYDTHDTPTQASNSIQEKFQQIQMQQMQQAQQQQQQQQSSSSSGGWFS